MVEYIERERLVKHYENCIDEVKNTNGITEDFEICLKALKAQTVADVVEVKHGHWIEDNEFFRCSECGLLTDFRLSNFCPNCGAKMDGKDGKT